ncbi:MAG: diaminopimelate epimerase [Wenzhouxiangellaceae bacterium]|nr:diaminopimelate epimerase [Wenzhouxiangellaceae bacterium]
MTRPAPGPAFSKLEALGNDFVLIDARAAPVELGSNRVRELADRRTGIGCDQLLVLEPADDACARVAIFNADGTPAEQCGNGMRAIAAWLDRAGELASGLKLTTPAGPVVLDRAEDGQYAAELPGPEPLTPEQLELAAPTLPGHACGWKLVSMGNPHLVVDWPDPPSAADLAAVVSQIENDRAWRNRVNIGLAHVDAGGHVLLRVHERGAGPTPACGSAACAAAVAVGPGRDDSTALAVIQPGGTIVVDLTAEGRRVRTRGPARIVYDGRLA